MSIDRSRPASDSGGKSLMDFLNNEGVRAVLYQVIGVLLVVAAIWYLASNTIHNLEVRNINTGFGYLDQPASFEVSESLIAYTPENSYGRVLVVGLLNTLKIAVIGIVLATFLGVVIGVARLSNNWMIAKLASFYVEMLRNIPLLLQLFFWYSLITELLPNARNAVSIFDLAFLSNRGMQVPVPDWGITPLIMFIALVIGFIATLRIGRWAEDKQNATGERPPVWHYNLAALLGLPIVVWLFSGAPTAFDVPEMTRFNFRGGGWVSPEFIALLLGLVLYTAAFIAEIVRSGILAVNKGQWEAGMSLGISRANVLRLIILPQALRVIIPPTTSQYLNLTKNSSLAVAVGYMDIVAVANITINQSGQAIENIAIIMAAYLTVSLSISAFMNWYNKRIALVER